MRFKEVQWILIHLLRIAVRNCDNLMPLSCIPYIKALKFDWESGLGTTKISHYSFELCLSYDGMKIAFAPWAWLSPSNTT